VDIAAIETLPGDLLLEVLLLDVVAKLRLHQVADDGCVSFVPHPRVDRDVDRPLRRPTASRAGRRASTRRRWVGRACSAATGRQDDDRDRAEGAESQERAARSPHGAPFLISRRLAEWSIR